MNIYTAALPNKVCQDYIDRTYPSMRYMLSPMCIRSFGKDRHHIVKRGYAIDNGAYGYYLRNKDFDDKAFYKLLDNWSTGCDWVLYFWIITRFNTGLGFFPLLALKLSARTFASGVNLKILLKTC